MLLVGYQGRRDFPKVSGEIHVQDGTKHLDELARVSVEEVTYVQADGHELQAIFDQFENLLHHKSARVQVFRGTTAKFIVEHMRL